MARTPDQVFVGLIEDQLSRRGIEVGKMFGSPVLKMRGKVFAMRVKERLVVKLPKERVDKLLQSPGFKRFDPPWVGCVPRSPVPSVSPYCE